MAVKLRDVSSRLFRQLIVFLMFNFPLNFAMRYLRFMGEKGDDMAWLIAMFWLCFRVPVTLLFLIWLCSKDWLSKQDKTSTWGLILSFGVSWACNSFFDARYLTSLLSAAVWFALCLAYDVWIIHLKGQARLGKLPESREAGSWRGKKNHGIMKAD